MNETSHSHSHPHPHGQPHAHGGGASASVHPGGLDPSRLFGGKGVGLVAMAVTVVAVIAAPLMPQAWILATLIGLPLVFAAGAVARPAAAAKVWALGGTLASAALIARLLATLDWGSAEIQAEAGWDWLPALGLRFSVGVDTVAALLLGLTGLLGPICVLGSWNAVTEKPKLFYGWLLVLQAAMAGVFAARDLVLFYICFEFTLLPMFVLINEFGSSNRKRAAVKFFLYTFTGSLIALAGLVYAAWAASTRADGDAGLTLDITTLTLRCAVLLSPAEQTLVMLAMLCGFAVKVPLFPFHTWLPLAHTEAPTAGSVVLAGVLLKLGTYAIYRFVLPLTPVAAYDLAPIIGVLSIIGIVYAGLICWVQTDVKKLVAYSSVSHLGFCVLGLFALNTAGLTGSVLYMINHGLSTGALFLLIGFMYERYHTRDMNKVGGLAAKMPVWSFFMVFFTMASVGLPGLNGFVSEFLCTMGAFQSHTPWTAARTSDISAGATFGPLGPWFGFAAATGVIVAAMYLLTMLAKVVWGPLKEPHDEHGHGHGGEPAAKVFNVAHVRPRGPLPADLTTREVLCLTALAFPCVVFGLYPKPLLSALEAPVNKQVALVQRYAENAPADGRLVMGWLGAGRASPRGPAGANGVAEAAPEAALVEASR